MWEDVGGGRSQGFRHVYIYIYFVYLKRGWCKRSPHMTACEYGVSNGNPSVIDVSTATLISCLFSWRFLRLLEFSRTRCAVVDMILPLRGHVFLADACFGIVLRGSF